MRANWYEFYDFFGLWRRGLPSWRDLAPLCFLSSLFIAWPAIGQTDYSDADAEYAQQLVKQRCAKCHGDDGRGVNQAYASLAGQPAEYLLKQLFNFSTGQRQSAKMQPIAKKLSARDAYILAEYFSRRRPGFTPSKDEASKTAGRKLYFEGNAATAAYNCVSCHGTYPAGGGPVPRLAGQNPAYLETQIRRLTEQSRGNDRAMHYINATLTGSEIRSLAVYLAAQE